MSRRSRSTARCALSATSAACVVETPIAFRRAAESVSAPAGYGTVTSLGAMSIQSLAVQRFPGTTVTSPYFSEMILLTPQSSTTFAPSARAAARRLMISCWNAASSSALLPMPSKPKSLPGRWVISSSSSTTYPSFSCARREDMKDLPEPGRPSK